MLYRIYNFILYFLTEGVTISGWRKHYFLLRLLKTQWNQEAADKMALRKFNKLIRMAGKHNIYYKNRLGISGDVFNIDTIRELPVLEKNDVRQFNKELCSDLKGEVIKAKTSGSTGIPVEAWINRYALDWRNAGYLRFLLWHGIKPWERYVLLWSKAKDTGRSGKSKLKRALFNPQYFINIFELDDESFLMHYHKIEKYKPVMFKSYPSGARQFALLAKKHGLDLKSLGIRKVITTGELLEKDNRNFIEAEFGCRVADEYGAAEVAQIAHECPLGKMHVPGELVYVWAEENNEALVTNLDNYYFPFINYRVGDTIKISMGKCNCGRGGMILEEITGRNSDIIDLPGGKRVSQTFLTYMFKDVVKLHGLDSVQQWRVIQKGTGFTVEIVRGAGYNADIEDFIRSRFREQIGEEICPEFRYVDSIEKEKSGKLRYFIRHEQ
jgi:phenylacetate-CoA ligase